MNNPKKENTLQEGILRGPCPPSQRWEWAQFVTHCGSRADGSLGTRSPSSCPIPASCQGCTFSSSSPFCLFGRSCEGERLHAFQKAKSQAVIPPVEDQITATQGSIARAKKRFVAEEEAVQQAIKKRDESLDAIVKAEKRLEELEL